MGKRSSSWLMQSCTSCCCCERIPLEILVSSSTMVLRCCGSASGRAGCPSAADELRLAIMVQWCCVWSYSAHDFDDNLIFYFGVSCPGVLFEFDVLSSIFPMKSRGFFYSHFVASLKHQTLYPSLHFPIFVPSPQNWNTCSLTRRQPFCKTACSTN